MGADSFAGFSGWDRAAHKVGTEKVPDWQYMMEKFSVAIMSRPGDDEKALNSPTAHYADVPKFENPKMLTISKNGWAFVPNPPLDISSTKIRAGIAARQDNIPGLPSAVNQYIQRYGLYPDQATQVDIKKPYRELPNPVPMEAMVLFARVANVAKASAEFSSDGVIEAYEAAYRHAEEFAPEAVQTYPKQAVAQCVSVLEKSQDKLTLQQGLTAIESLAGIMHAEKLELPRAQALLHQIFSDDYIPDAQAYKKKTLEGIAEYVEFTGPSL